jgi:hypothetical protein
MAPFFWYENFLWQVSYNKNSTEFHEIRATIKRKYYLGTKCYNQHCLIDFKK